jgi:hypothetical protein
VNCTVRKTQVYALVTQPSFIAEGLKGQCQLQFSQVVYNQSQILNFLNESHFQRANLRRKQSIKPQSKHAEL